MATRTELVEVWIWQQRIGAVALDTRSTAVFEYDRTWLQRGIELAPLMMPLATARQSPLFTFPNLSRDTYRGLPGMLADALPDAFGNALIDAWMATHGVRKDQVTVLDKLAYMGTRGMGALEFRPPLGTVTSQSDPIAMQELVEAARSALRGDLTTEHTSKSALQAMIDVGTSAGGARAKAVIAWNPETHEVRSGQFEAPAGFEHWLLKLDTGRDVMLGDSTEFGRAEYAYHLMAVDSGIQMSPCRLLRENGRAHFMTRRFDRFDQQKHHVQSLCALAHLDFNQVGTHSYEQLFMVADQLVGPQALKQIFTRMCFNIVARNCDDHTKNFAFLLKQGGLWELAPAFDVTYSYKPDSPYVSKHQMSVNGAFDRIRADDVLKVAERFGIENPAETIERVNQVVANWPAYAREADVGESRIEKVATDHQPIALVRGASQTRRRLGR